MCPLDSSYQPGSHWYRQNIPQWPCWWGKSGQRVHCLRGVELLALVSWFLFESLRRSEVCIYAHIIHVHACAYTCLCVQYAKCLIMCEHTDGRAQLRLSRTGWAELSWAIHWTGLCPEHRQLITSYSSLCSQAAIWRMDQMVSRNAYIGKAAPSDVEIFQSFPWLLPDFTICLYTLYITLVSVFQRNRTS